MITTENITRHELIGLETSIEESTDLQLVGIHGKIVDETKSMFTIETETGVKKLPKGISTWKFNLSNTVAIVNGKTIIKRSYERVGVRA
jgi:ribonuclease P protein subunit POP4